MKLHLKNFKYYWTILFCLHPPIFPVSTNQDTYCKLWDYDIWYCALTSDTLPLLRNLQCNFFCRWKIVLQKLWKDCQFENCFSFRMGIFYFRRMPSSHSIYIVHKPRILRSQGSVPYDLDFGQSQYITWARSPAAPSITCHINSER